ncbi:hypothetical protein DASC09_031030 [Saccharomycopsis crataegensis]|uniref:Kinetochore protein SPC25 n=1 Tax=Saccharomycopsis crataegensis TaxID=43959 RepID=A0AAV5QLP1_9ASCO|nr:hypothetical protein DASC09_031030 [Saccharomycopsis crataegensis]
MTSPDLLPLDQIDSRLGEFHSRFKTTMQQYKTSLSDSKTEYISQYEVLVAKQKEIHQKLKKLADEDVRVRELLNNELNTLSDAKSKIEELKKNETVLIENKNSINEKIEILDSQIDIKNSDLNSSKRNLNRNLQKDLSVVKLYESFLGLKIDSIDNDLIKFQFFNLLQNDLDLEFEVVLDLSDPHGNYKINSMSYQLPESELAEVLNSLNKNRNLVLFLKSIRSCFVKNYSR